MRTKTILSVALVCLSLTAFSGLTLTPNGVFAECPNEWIVFTAVNDFPAGCQYDWTVTNGEIQGGFQNGNTSTFTGGAVVSIRWFDTTQDGNVSVQAFSCNNNNGNTLVAKTIPILSLNGVTPDNITGDDEVAANITTNKVYEVA